MEFKISDIAMRIRGLRDDLGLSVEEIALECEVTPEEFRLCEAGECDFSFTFLYKCAKALNIDLTELLTGETAKLSGCSLVKAGQGLPIKRRAGFEYLNLAYIFKNRTAEPFLVTAPYDESADAAPIHLSSHAGQEMDYILSGSLKFHFDGHEMILNPGDTVYYDGMRPHGMVATGGQSCTFIAIVIANS